LRSRYKKLAGKKRDRRSQPKQPNHTQAITQYTTEKVVEKMASRPKRSTAGNKLAALIAELDVEKLRNEEEANEDSDVLSDVTDASAAEEEEEEVSGDEESDEEEDEHVKVLLSQTSNKKSG